MRQEATNQESGNGKTAANEPTAQTEPKEMALKLARNV
jgi:hypothetical protein